MESALIRKIGFRAKNKLRTLRALIPTPRPEYRDFLREIDLAEPGIVLGQFPLIFAGCGITERITRLRQDFPKCCNDVESLACRSSEHRFDLLGSGLTNLGGKIDWLTDFKSGRRWDIRDYRLQKVVDLTDDSDVKVPWELSRCNHFVQMAVAYLLTDNHIFPVEFEKQIISWCEENPFEMSINWTCAMETAFRCINWLLAYQIFNPKWDFSAEFKELLVAELYKGGRFIRQNLEGIGPGFNNNHYISDLLGLLYLGELFKTKPYGEEWRRFAIHELESEITYQIYEDGVAYESSLPYHGLVTELFYYAWLLSRRSDFGFSPRYEEILRKMVSNLELFTQGNGQVIPQGDGDDGRLIRLFDRHPRDFRDIIASAAGSLKLSIPGTLLCQPETLLILKDNPADNGLTKLPHEASSLHFETAGICLLQGKESRMTFFATQLGTAGLGAHKHNDNLSFTLEYQGGQIFVDPGSYVYTTDERWRKKFRSTRSHNTVMIDGFEQNRTVDGLLFLLRNDSKPRITSWKSDESSDFVTAMNDGYERLDDPVTHKRSIYLDKIQDVYLIRDDLLALGSHEVEINFHTGNLVIDVIDHSTLYLRNVEAGKGVLLTSLQFHASLTVNSDWVSSSYGIKEPGLRISSSSRTQLPLSLVFAIAPCTYGTLDSTRINAENIKRKLGW